MLIYYPIFSDPIIHGPIPPLLSFDKEAIDEHLKKIEEEFNKLEEEITNYEKKNI